MHRRTSAEEASFEEELLANPPLFPLLLLRSSSPTIAEAAKRWCRLLCRAEVDAVLRQKIRLPTTEEDVETSAAKPTEKADAAVFAAALAAARLISLSLHVAAVVWCVFVVVR